MVVRSWAKAGCPSDLDGYLSGSLSVVTMTIQTRNGFAVDNGNETARYSWRLISIPIRHSDLGGVKKQYGTMTGGLKAAQLSILIIFNFLMAFWKDL